MNEVLVDTNIFIYALDKDSINNASSKKILTNHDLLLYTTTKNISEIFALTSKLNFDMTFVNSFYLEIKRNVQFLFPTTASLNIFEKLIQKYQPIGNRVFDVEIVSIMISSGIKKLATFNTKDFKEIKEIELVKL